MEGRQLVKGIVGACSRSRTQSRTRPARGTNLHTIGVHASRHYLRQEPDALVALVRICGGGVQQCASLLRRCLCFLISRHPAKAISNPTAARLISMASLRMKPRPSATSAPPSIHGAAQQSSANAAPNPPTPINTPPSLRFAVLTSNSSFLEFAKSLRLDRRSLPLEIGSCPTVVTDKSAI